MHLFDVKGDFIVFCPASFAQLSNFFGCGCYCFVVVFFLECFGVDVFHGVVNVFVFSIVFILSSILVLDVKRIHGIL